MTHVMSQLNCLYPEYESDAKDDLKGKLKWNNKFFDGYVSFESINDQDQWIRSAEDEHV